MELLRFNDAPRSSRRGKNPAGFIGAGIMVAVMGLSSTLAGTITIGTGTVEFGQGVVNTAACDSTLTVTPTSSYSYSADTFTVSSIKIEGIGGVANTGTGNGCLGKIFEIRAYSDGGERLEFQQLVKAIQVTIPSTAANADTNTNYTKAGYAVDSDGILGSVQTFTGLIAVNNAESVNGVGFSATTASATGAGSITISNLSLPARVTRITIESKGS